MGFDLIEMMAGMIPQINAAIPKIRIYIEAYPLENLISIGIGDSIRLFMYGRLTYAIRNAVHMHVDINPRDTYTLRMKTLILSSPSSILVAVSLLLLPVSATLRFI